MKKLLLLAIAIVLYAIAILAKPAKKEPQQATGPGSSASTSKTFQ